MPTIDQKPYIVWFFQVWFNDRTFLIELTFNQYHVSNVNNTDLLYSSYLSIKYTIAWSNYKRQGFTRQKTFQRRMKPVPELRSPTCRVYLIFTLFLIFPIWKLSRCLQVQKGKRASNRNSFWNEKDKAASSLRQRRTDFVAVPSNKLLYSTVSPYFFAFLSPVKRHRCCYHCCLLSKWYKSKNNFCYK